MSARSLSHMVAYAPAIFVVALVVSLIFHVFFPTPFLPTDFSLWFGVALLIIAPFLIVWAQKHRRHLYHPEQEKHAFEFHRGPYKFSRHPTYLGLATLLLGFGVLVNSLIIVITSVVVFLIYQIIIIPREERMLHKETKGKYKEYMNKVKTVFGFSRSSSS